jgi:predicted phosphodiesterase
MKTGRTQRPRLREALRRARAKLAKVSITRASPTDLEAGGITINCHGALARGQGDESTSVPQEEHIEARVVGHTHDELYARTLP